MALCWNVHVDKGGETMEYFNAFWAGGLICALVQILLDRTKLMPGRVMVWKHSVSGSQRGRPERRIHRDL